MSDAEIENKPEIVPGQQPVAGKGNNSSTERLQHAASAASASEPGEKTQSQQASRAHRRSLSSGCRSRTPLSAPPSASERRTRLRQMSSSKSSEENPADRGRALQPEKQLQIDLLASEFIRISLLLDGHSKETLSAAGVAHSGVNRCSGDEVPRETQVAQQLAEIAHEFDRKEAQETQIRWSEREWEYSDYKKVAMRVLHRDLKVKWGNIIAIFFFTARIAGNRLRSGRYAGVLEVIAWLAKFIMEELVRWIMTEGGGWLAAMNAHIQDSSARTLYLCFGVAACALLGYIVFTKFRPSPQ